MEKTTYHIVRDIVIKWKCPSRDNINNIVAFTEKDELCMIINSSDPLYLLPQGSIITDQYDGKKYKLEYTEVLVNNASSYPYVLHVAPEVIYIDYYRYMRTFTVCYDGLLKEEDRHPNWMNYKIVLPTDIQEWRHDIIILDNQDALGSFDYSFRRCKLKDGVNDE